MLIGPSALLHVVCHILNSICNIFSCLSSSLCTPVLSHIPRRRSRVVTDQDFVLAMAMGKTQYSNPQICGARSPNWPSYVVSCSILLPPQVLTSIFLRIQPFNLWPTIFSSNDRYRSPLTDPSNQYTVHGHQCCTLPARDLPSKWLPSRLLPTTALLNLETQCNFKY